jgi:S1-C subfamily serine protease
LVLVGVLAGFGLSQLIASGPSSAVQAQATPATSAIESGPAIGVYATNGSRVVNIISLSIISSNSGIVQPSGVGSGFVWDSQGHIVTNDHVIQDANQLQVTFKDRTTQPAKLVGRDPPNDLAVIQVADLGSSQPVTLGDSDSVQIGQIALAIGSPLGLQQTMTQGIVSALRLPGDEATTGGLSLLGGAVQTDASINPGNSGGPLFDSAGNVIGVNTAIVSQTGGNEGIGFAIPINVVKRVVPQLIQYGRYRHPQLGIVGIPVSEMPPQARQLLGVPANVQQGVLVVQATDAAQTAGIQEGTTLVQVGPLAVPAGGDIVLSIDGHTVGSTGELRAYIENNKNPGDTVTLTVLRNGQQMDVPVTLTERPAQF